MPILTFFANNVIKIYYLLGIQYQPSARHTPQGRDRDHPNQLFKEKHKMLGALGGDGKPHKLLPKGSSPGVIDLLERLRVKYGRIFVILDNAGAHKSKAIKEYLEKTRGSIVLHYLPLCTPQQNPIEIPWREIKRAVGGRYFEGGFEQMEKSIRRMLRGQSLHCKATGLHV